MQRNLIILLISLWAVCSCAQDVAPDLHLSGFRAKDDLSGWIYAQLQWTAKAPARRSTQLVSAVRLAWRLPRDAEEQQAWLDLLTNEGYSLLLAGSIVTSTDAYTAAYEFARHHAAIIDAGLVLETVLKPLGNNYTRLGDYEQALYIHRKAETLAKALDDPGALAGVYGNLANTCGNMGQPAWARDYCRKGLAIAGKRTAISGLLLSELADAYRALGSMDSARFAIKRSIDVLQNASDYPSANYWLLMAYQSAGDLYGGSEIALRFYQKAYDLQHLLDRQDGESHQRDRAKLFYRLGAFYVRSANSAMATRWLDSCLAVLEPGCAIAALGSTDLYAENTLADALFLLAGLQKDAGEAIRLYELSFATEKKGRQQLITSGSKEQWVADARSRYEKAIGLAWDNWNRTKQPAYASAMLRLVESSKSQLLLDEFMQQQELRSSTDDSISRRIHLLENADAYYRREMIGNRDSMALSRLRETDWQLARLRKEHGAGETPVFSADSLSRLLGENMIARDYFAGEKALYTIECGHDGIRYIDKLPLDSGWQNNVRGFTSRWFGAGVKAMINDPSHYYQEARGLFDQFFTTHPMLSDKTYILLPDGALSLLPVEALITPGDGVSAGAPATWPFVIRKTTLSYGYSLQTLWQQRAEPAAGGFSGFFLSGNRRNLAALQATAEERSGIQPFIREGDWYNDSMATTSAFGKAVTSSSIIHISSHAFAGTDSLDAPHIELYDAPFYIFELQGLGLHPALVVLSACRTGDGRYLSGEGVQSLARGFTTVGSDAVVAGWWNVNDEAAEKLVTEFYQQMNRQNGTSGGIDAVSALRNAKLVWLNDGSHLPMLQLPYYWASLNYQGNPKPFGQKPSIALMGTPLRGRILAWVAHTGRYFAVLLLFLTAGLLLIRSGRRSKR